MAREYDWFNSQPVILANFLAGDDNQIRAEIERAPTLLSGSVSSIG
jgi:hypothetical protein